MANIVLKYFMMAVTLIVMAVPEGLPMAVTLSLALNMKRMLVSGNLVRTLQASETMGAVNVICTDKTGTLTQNRMTVNSVVRYDGNLIDEAISVNSTAELNSDKNIGNPTEVAMLRWLEGRGVDYRQLRNDSIIEGQIAFSTEKKYMATATDKYIYVKGAPELVLSMCDFDAKHLDKEDIEAQLLSMQRRGMRTLALCYKPREGEEPLTEDNLPRDGYTLQAIVAIADPVRPDVPGAVDECRRAGIEVKIVTGDNAATAAEIARQIDILPREGDIDPAAVITGKEWQQLTDYEAMERVEHIAVMSRARPADKQRLVDLLRQRGNVVAVTGDGTNDAPALHHAHVGLSLGSGTSVAKSASDITLLDDSFGSISKAVMWGRSLYKNIQRFLFFQLVVNLSALLLVMGGSIIGTEMPLTVTQILWVNLIMDTFAALALASLPPSREVMKEKPRQSTDFIITRKVGRQIVLTSLIFFVVMFIMLIYCERNGSAGVDIHELTIFFTTFVMLQVWNLFNAKALGSTHSAFHNMAGSMGMLFVLLLIVVGQVLIVHFGGRIFRTVPLSGVEWLAIIAATSTVMLVGEIVRLWKRTR
jgi:Ca2+-transporting ATPase